MDFDYQKIYDSIADYGRVEFGHCPGIRTWDYYQQWFKKGPSIDLGSGTGDTSEFLRSQNIESNGIDIIKPESKYCVQGDITLSMDLKKYKTVTCFDVIEHLNNSQVNGLLGNMVQCDRQIFTVDNGPSLIEYNGKKEDLHINKKAWPQWRGIFNDYFDIYQEFEIRTHQHLYLCKRKNGDGAMIEYLGKKGYIITKGD